VFEDGCERGCGRPQLQLSATRFTLHHTATHCNIRQCTATHCNALRRTATHCNTLRHTATHCNTLRSGVDTLSFAIIRPFSPSPPPPTHTRNRQSYRCYGVATISRLLQIIGLFCKRALRKRRYSAKKTYNFMEPIHRSHLIPLATQMKPMNESCLTYERLMSHI